MQASNLNHLREHMHVKRHENCEQETRVLNSSKFHFAREKVTQ